MMHQNVNQSVPEVEFNDRPNRTFVIQIDEIVDLRIDLEILDAEQIYDKYFI
jgi:hypothetical protein